MGFFTKHKKMLIVALLIAVGFIAYGYFGGGEGEEDLLLVSDVANDPLGGGDPELLGLLVRLETIMFDKSIFSDSRFRSLVDFSVEIEPQPVGRPNPFAPI